MDKKKKIGRGKHVYNWNYCKTTVESEWNAWTLQAGHRAEGQGCAWNTGSRGLPNVSDRKWLQFWLSRGRLLEQWDAGREGSQHRAEQRPIYQRGEGQPGGTRTWHMDTSAGLKVWNCIWAMGSWWWHRAGVRWEQASVGKRLQLWISWNKPNKRSTLSSSDICLDQSNTHLRDVNLVRFLEEEDTSHVTGLCFSLSAWKETESRNKKMMLRCS